MSINSFSQVYEKVCPSRELSEEQLNYCFNKGTSGEQGTGQETVEDLSTQLRPFFEIGCWEEQASEDLFDFGDMDTSSQKSLMDRCKCQHDTGMSFCKSKEEFYRDLNLIKVPIKKKVTEGMIALISKITIEDLFNNPETPDNERKFCRHDSLGKYLTQLGCSASAVTEINNIMNESHFNKCHTERGMDTGSSFKEKEQKAYCGPPASIDGYEQRYRSHLKGNALNSFVRIIRLSHLEKDILGINQATADILNVDNINDELQLNTDLVENFTFSFRDNENLDNFIASSLGLSLKEREDHLVNLRKNLFLITNRNEQFPNLSEDKIKLFRKIQIRLKTTPDFNHLFLLSNNQADFSDFQRNSMKNLRTLQIAGNRLGTEASSDQVNKEINNILNDQKCGHLAEVTQVMCNPDYNFFKFFPDAEGGLETDELLGKVKNIGKLSTSSPELESAADHLSCAAINSTRQENNKMSMESFGNDGQPNLNIPFIPGPEQGTAQDAQITQAKRVARRLNHLEQTLKRDSSPEAQERVFKQLKDMDWPDFMGANPFTGSMTVDDAIFKARNSLRDWIIDEADSIEADFESGQKQRRADALNRLNAFKNGGMERLAEELDTAIERTNPSRRGYVKRAQPKQESNYVSRGGKTKSDEVRWQPSWTSSAPAPVAGTGATPTGEPTYEEGTDPFKMVPRPEEKAPKTTIPKADITASTKSGGSSGGRGIASAGGGSLGANAIGTGPSSIDEGPIVLSMEEAKGEEFDNKLKTEDKLFVYDYKEDIVMIYEKDDKGKQAELVRKIPRVKVEKAPEEFPEKLFRIFKRYRVKRLNHLLSHKNSGSTLDQTS